MLLQGKVPVARRDEMVCRFQAGEIKVFLLSLKAGGTGLNLTRARHVVHYDRWWNPAVEDQASDRAYRIGQDHAVQIHRLVTEGTLEDRIASLMAAKRDLAERVVGAGEGWIGELSNDDLSALVSLGRHGMSPVARDRSRREFGRTWWGRAWTDAMEQRARLDPNRLPRGRTYARRGRVGALTVEPGSVRAAVAGSRVMPYLVHVRVRTLDHGEWERLLDAIAARAAHTAALLDGDLPPEVVADAASAGVDLLPGAGEVGPRCSCPDWADPCKHAAAVVYLMADVLDTDPFALLLLRGRTRDEVLAGLRRRRAGSSRGSAGAGALTRGRPADPGLPAREAYAAGHGAGPGAGGAAVVAPMPAVPAPPRRPGDPVPLAVDPPPDAGIVARDLAALAGDAARRAWELCVGDGDGGLGLDPGLDLVRRAAASWPGAARPSLDQVAARAGMPPRELARRAAAWRLGGADAVAVLDEEWAADPEALDEARAACAGLGPVRVRANRVSPVGAGLQLRLGRAGWWYRFERVGRTWELTEGPEADPAALVPPGTRHLTPGATCSTQR